MSFVTFFQLRIANAMVMMILVPQKKIDQLEDCYYFDHLQYCFFESIPDLHSNVQHV